MDKKTFDVAVLEAQIVELAQAERITKQVLGSLSRDLLLHYVDSGDVALINKLLGLFEEDSKFVLTPMNWRLAVQYFRAFIPHASNWDDVKDYAEKGEGKRIPYEFGKKSGNRAKKIGDALDKWLAIEDNNIWIFSKQIEVKVKPTDYAGQITKAIEKAMDEEKGDLSEVEVFRAIFAAEGIDATALIAAMEAAAHAQPAHNTDDLDVEDQAA